MKKIFLFALTLSLFTACGKGKNARQIAEEVCDCSEKANAMDASDPKRPVAQADCAKLQVESWDKVKNNQKDADEFNKVLSERLEALIKKSKGQ